MQSGEYNDTKIKLLNLVEKNPCLYNNQLSDYARKDVVDATWANIAKELNVPVTYCKEKWKNLRTAFVRNLKHKGSEKHEKRPYYLNDRINFLIPYLKASHAENENRSDNFHKIETRIVDEWSNSEIEEETEYKVFEQDSNIFRKLEENPLELKDTRVESSTTGCNDISNVSVNNNGSQKIVNERSAVLKRKRNGADQGINDPFEISSEDERKMFLLSLLPEINDLTEMQMRKFRRKVFILIDEISLS